MLSAVLPGSMVGLQRVVATSAASRPFRSSMIILRQTLIRIRPYYRGTSALPLLRLYQAGPHFSMRQRFIDCITPLSMAILKCRARPHEHATSAAELPECHFTARQQSRIVILSRCKQVSAALTIKMPRVARLHTISSSPIPHGRTLHGMKHTACQVVILQRPYSSLDKIRKCIYGNSYISGARAFNGCLGRCAIVPLIALPRRLKLAAIKKLLISTE